MSAGCEGGRQIQGKSRVPGRHSIGWRGWAVPAAGEAPRTAAGLHPRLIFLQLLGGRQSPRGQRDATAELRPDVLASPSSKRLPSGES